MMPFFTNDLAGLDGETVGKSSGLFGLAAVHFNAGEIIYSSGAPFNGIFIIRKGIAKNYTLLEDIEVLTALSLRGDVLGVDSLHSSTYLSQAVAAVDLDAVWVPMNCFILLLRMSTEFRSSMYESIGKALSTNAAMITLLSKSDAEEKVVFLLLKVYAASCSESGSKGKNFNIGLSRAEMAEYLGLRVETISRKLTLLAELGYIRVRGRRILLRDYEGLKKICRSTVRMVS